MLRTKLCIFQPIRWRHSKDHWSMKLKKKFPKDRALENFDDFYGSVFGTRWKNMRVALLTEHKYVALVNILGDLEKTVTSLELDGAMNVKLLTNVTKERLRSGEKKVFAERNTYKLDQTLGGFIRKQEDQEISAIYPETTEKLSKLQSNDENSETIDGKNEIPVDYKKPLEKVLREDTEIDVQRVVDTSYGTGGLYEFIPATKIKGMEDWIPESDHYKYYSNTTDFPMSFELENDISYPENLHLFTYEKGNCSKFFPPEKCLTGSLSHFLMDGASILPPLFLDVQPGDKVLDACAAPGGKSLIMLQTLHPEILVCNDIQESRVNRIKNIMYQYIYNFDQKWNGKRCLITQSDARALRDYNEYDKILVDVPCTTDRHVLTENDNNIFKPSRIKERLRLPELQSGILSNCLRLLKPGGSLVYSTCSLSPIQNDGVVHMSLQKVFNDFGITTTVKDLSVAIQQFSDIFQFENPKGLKYGQMVIPYLPANFGPMYFCKITRNK